MLTSTPLAPESYGSRIYLGHVFGLGESPAPQLFEYERRVKRLGESLYSTSFTREGEQVALIEVAEHGPGFELQTYTEYQYQTINVGKVSVIGKIVQIQFIDDRGERRAQEPLDGPVVVGPTLYGFVLSHWDELISGAKLSIRFAVPERLETIGFVLERTHSVSPEVIIRMRPTNPLIALIVSPLKITFNGRSIVRLEGRVPTKRRVEMGWANLDARVEYENDTPTYH